MAWLAALGGEAGTAASAASAGETASALGGSAVGSAGGIGTSDVLRAAGTGAAYPNPIYSSAEMGGKSWWPETFDAVNKALMRRLDQSQPMTPMTPAPLPNYFQPQPVLASPIGGGGMPM